MKFYSYVMGIGNRIHDLPSDGFATEEFGDDYGVTFSHEKVEEWEKFIKDYLAVGFWNEYLANDGVVFLFHLKDGFKRYHVTNYENDEVLALCEKLCKKKLSSLKDMIIENRFYSEKLEVQPYSKEMDLYLACDDVIDWKNEKVMQKAEEIYQSADGEVDFIRKAFEFVLNQIAHSADINEDAITCAASEVLEAGHGICFAKAHLLVALLRCKGVPCGFCYQKLILDDEIAPVLIYHGLNGVYLKEYHKWIRLDPRGNKEGVNAQFSIDEEKLAFPIRPEKGEEDSRIVYANPDASVLRVLRRNQTRTELWKDLPTELAVNKRA